MPFYDPTAPISIFDGASDGYGYAIAQPGLSTLHWTYNWDCTRPGRAVPSLAPIELTTPTVSFDVISFAFRWDEPTTLRPILLFGTGDGVGGTKIIGRFRDGVSAADDTRPGPHYP